MSTPSRRTRSRNAQSIEPESIGTRAVPRLTPSRAGSQAPQESPRRNPRRGSTPAKLVEQLPELINRSSTAYGTQGRLALAESIEHTQTADERLDAIREEGEDDEEEADEVVEEEKEEDEEEEEEEEEREEERQPSIFDPDSLFPPRYGRRSRQASNAPSEYVIMASGVRRGVGRPRKQPTLAPGDSSADAGAQSQRRPSRALSGRAPSVDGTTVMDNGGNYGPLFHVAEETEPVPLPPHPSVIDTIRNYSQLMGERISQAYHNRPHFPRWAWMTVALIVGIALSTPWLLSSLPFVSRIIPSRAGVHYSIEYIKNISNTAWSSIRRPEMSNGTALVEYDNRVTDIEAKVENVTKIQYLHTDTIAKLEQILPQYIFAVNESGHWQIPEELFDALQERLDAEKNRKPQEPIQSPDWDMYLQRTEARVNELMHADYENKVQDKRIISHHEVIRLFDEKLKEMVSSVNVRWEGLEERVKSSVSETSKDTMKNMIIETLGDIPEKQLRMIDAYRLLRNTELNERSVNFFNPVLGAVVDPYLSSTSYEKPRPWFHKRYAAAMNIRLHNPHIAALERWEEVGDCWCAAPPLPYTRVQPEIARASERIISGWHVNSNDDVRSQGHEMEPNQIAPKAQLAVIMPYEIYPRYVTIEHVPRTATLDIGSAPRKIEVWVEITNKTEHALAVEMARQYYTDYTPEYPPATSRRSGIALNENYIRIAAWNYDPRNVNHVQTRRIQVELEKIEVAVSKVVIRAVTNWGREFTCLYRVRMHGKVKNPNPDWVMDQWVKDDMHDYYNR